MSKSKSKSKSKSVVVANEAQGSQAIADGAEQVVVVPAQEEAVAKALELLGTMLGNEPAAPEVPIPAKVQVLHVKQGMPLRGGRGEWYKLLCKYDGKPLAEFLADGKANPASHYTARSKKMGQPKTPESRLSWFKRAGIVTVE